MFSGGNYIESAFECVDEDSLKIHLQNFEVTESVKSLFKDKPCRATEFSAGYDLGVIDDVVIPARTSKFVTFGNVVRVENGFYIGVVVPRSSLAKKRGLILANGPYFIYKGTDSHLLSLKFINFTDEDVELKAGDKIAQCLFIKFPSWLISDTNEMEGELCEEVIISDNPLDEHIMSPMLEDNIETLSGHPVDSISQWVYSFQAPENVELLPGKVTCVMTGLRCKCNLGQVFILKCALNNSCVELANCIGIIDADYYDNPDNKGEIGVLLLNRGTQPVKINSGDVIATGSLYSYGTIVGDSFGGKRLGGFGSTDKN